MDQVAPAGAPSANAARDRNGFHTPKLPLLASPAPAGAARVALVAGLVRRTRAIALRKGFAAGPRRMEPRRSADRVGTFAKDPTPVRFPAGESAGRQGGCHARERPGPIGARHRTDVVQSIDRPA
jgi:hypothetical protein